MAGFGLRKSERRAYTCQQLVADYDGQTLPASTDFYWVTFLNISATGAAYLSPRKPKTPQVVIALGKSSILFVARVARTYYRTQLPGTPFEIGCEFVRRLDKDEVTPLPQAAELLAVK